MKAYLAWPVKLKAHLNCPDDLHITLKYIGKVKDMDTLIKTISYRLEHELQEFPLSGEFGQVTWIPQRFDRHVSVLELYHYDPRLDSTRAALASLVPEDYPLWSPYITIPKTTWFSIDKKATPQNSIEWIGPLTLFVKEEKWRQVSIPRHTF